MNAFKKGTKNIRNQWCRDRVFRLGGEAWGEISNVTVLTGFGWRERSRRGLATGCSTVVGWDVSAGEGTLGARPLFNLLTPAQVSWTLTTWTWAEEARSTTWTEATWPTTWDWSSTCDKFSLKLKDTLATLFALARRSKLRLVNRTALTRIRRIFLRPGWLPLNRVLFRKAEGRGFSTIVSTIGDLAWTEVESDSSSGGVELSETSKGSTRSSSTGLM